MSEPFVGEIRMFAGNFAPRGWAFCDGQLLGISQNDALFSLFGTIYGGDGRTIFGLPDLRGRFPLHYGSGPGLSPRNIGSRGGAESVALQATQAAHSHGLRYFDGQADNPIPEGAVFATSSVGDHQYRTRTGSNTMHSNTLSNTGGGQTHPNLPPFLCINFIVALLGIYPSRS